MVVKGYKKFEDFVDSTPDVMKFEIVAYVQVIVDNIKTNDPKFPLGEAWSLQDYMENA